MPTTWQIKGTGGVKDIPAGYMAVSVRITFWRKPAGMGEVSMFFVDQTIGVTGGAATFDTGFQNMAAPVAGNEYWIKVTGTVVANPLLLAIPIPAGDSAHIIPVP